MHQSAYDLGRSFVELYWQPNFAKVFELGSRNLNGTLRDHFPDGSQYVGVDTVDGDGVDILIAAGEPLPFPDNSFDVAISSSFLQSDFSFFDSFTELIRLLRPGGFLYLNVPSNYAYQRTPMDYWRFYPDAGHGLTQWSLTRGIAVQLIESFVAKPSADGWADFVAIFRKPAPSAVVRKSRLAETTSAANVFDWTFESSLLLQNGSVATFDMLQMEQTKAAASEAQRAYQFSQARLAESQRENKLLTAEIDRLNAPLISRIAAEWVRKLQKRVK